MSPFLTVVLRLVFRTAMPRLWRENRVDNHEEMEIFRVVLFAIIRKQNTGLDMGCIHPGKVLVADILECNVDLQLDDLPAANAGDSVKRLEVP